MMNRISKYTFGLFILSLTTILLFKALSGNLSYYQNSCPDDVLSWDGSLRLCEVIDQYQDFRQGNILRGFINLLDAPTWPAFRGFLSLLTFALTPGGPNVPQDVLITFLFFVGVFIAICYISFVILRKPVEASATFFLCTILLIHTRELPLISLSAMLETQGMFFTLLATYFLYRLYDEESQITAEVRKDYSRVLSIGLFISIGGVFHTKYPYGIMLLVSILACELIRRPSTYLDVIKLFYQKTLKGAPQFLFAAFILALIFFALTGKLGDQSPNPKLYKRLMYLGFLAILIYLNVKLYREKSLWSGLPSTMRRLYLTGFLPVLAWLFMHPTRFNTVLGTQQRLPPDPNAAKISFTRLFFNQFDFPPLLIAFTMIALFALTYGALQSLPVVNNRRDPETETGSDESKQSPLKEIFNAVEKILTIPLVAPIIMLLVQLLLLEFSTKNKQARHIYHLQPALLLFFSFWILELPSILVESVKLRRIFALTLSVVFVAGGLYFSYGDKGILSGSYHKNSRPLCFNGKKNDFFDPARWYAARIEPNKRYLTINTFHDFSAITRVYSVQMAPVIDLLMRMKAVQSPRGDLRSDSKYQYPDWKKFDSIIIISESCKQPVQDLKLQKRAIETKSKLKPTQEKLSPDGKFCYREYKITPQP